MSETHQHVMENIGDTAKAQGSAPMPVVVKRFRSFWQAIDFAAGQPRMHVSFADGAWEVRTVDDAVPQGEARPGGS